MSHRHEVPGTITGLIARMHAARRGGGVRPLCARFLSLHCQQHRVFILHFVNARGLRIVKCPLRMKRTRSFVAIVSWEEQSLSVLSYVGRDMSFTFILKYASWVRSSVCVFCLQASFGLGSSNVCIDDDRAFDSLYSGKSIHSV